MNFKPAPELRQIFRSLRRAPAFATLATLTIALGIGASAGVFSVINAAFLRPLPYANADDLVVIATTRNGDELSNSYPALLDWRAENKSFREIAGFSGQSVTLTGGDGAEFVRGQLVTPNLFRTLGVVPIAGRGFLDAEESFGTARTVVLGYNLWKRRFALDTAVVGRSIEIDRQSYTVVGVMPEGFDFPGGIVYGAAEVWMPSGLADARDWQDRNSHPGIVAVGRLKAGVTLAAANADMTRLARELSQRHVENRAEGVLLRSALGSLVGDLVPGLRLIVVAAVLLLVIALSNVAGLLLARGLSRQREIAVRTALGGTRSSIVMRLVVESVVISLAGGAMGLALAWASLKLSAPLLSTLPRLSTVTIDWRVALFAITLSAVAGALSGVLPALAVTGRHVAAWLQSRGNSVSKTARRTRPFLVCGEIAMALVLVVTATMLSRSFAKLQAEKGGIRAENALTFELRLPSATYDGGERVSNFYRALFERVTALPGVQSVGAISTLPFSGSGAQSGISTTGRKEDEQRTDVATVTPGYFAAMGVELVRGRTFNDADNDSKATPVAIVDEQFASKVWPGGDPIGKEVRGWGFQSLIVVGVVRHIKNYGVAAESRQELFVPHGLRAGGRMNVVVRSTSAPAVLTPLIRAAVKQADAQVPIVNLRPMQTVVNNTVASNRLAATISSSIGLIAMLLAAGGLYSILAFAVSERTREIGIRSALGATPERVIGMVVRQSLVLAGIGMGVGVLAAFAVGQVIKSQLFGILPYDPATFVAAVTLFGLVAALAAAVPAFRAAHISPLEALRAE